MGSSVQRAVVEIALSDHQKIGNVRGWRPSQPLRRGYVVTLSDGKETPLTVSEAWALCLGLESAHAAWSARLAAEQAAKARYDAEQAELAAARRLAYASAVAATGCPFCGSEAGTRCVRQAEDPTPYADRPHLVRLAQAAILKGAASDAQGG